MKSIVSFFVRSRLREKVDYAHTGATTEPAMKWLQHVAKVAGAGPAPGRVSDSTKKIVILSAAQRSRRTSNYSAFLPTAPLVAKLHSGTHWFSGPDNSLSGWRSAAKPQEVTAYPRLESFVPRVHLGTHGSRQLLCRSNALCAAALLVIVASSAQADITGTVTLIGKPNSKDETFVAQAANCGESPIRHTENWKVGMKGELGDVVVWIVDPKFEPVTVNPYLPIRVPIKQIGCRYVPHVVAVQAGIPFAITNGDPTLHNIRAKSYDGPGNPPGADIFNFGQGMQGQTDERQFDDPGIYTLQCDVHGWMQCWVMALKDDGFGVTDLDGKFKIQMIDASHHLIDGDYKIDAWHPRFGQTLEQTIHVKNGTATVAFQFDGSKSF